MGFSLKYGKVTLEKKVIPDDEPVFVFRAQDSLALIALGAYYEAVLVSGSMDDAGLERLKQQMANFRSWPTKKPPD